MPLRRGAEFLESLRDGRNVWLDGERVPEVTAHPRLAGCAKTIAELYDLQHERAHRHLLTTPSPTSGEPVSLAYLLPRSREDLRRRRRMIEFLMRRSGGTLGRLPEYMAAVAMGVYDVRDLLSQEDPSFGKNITSFFEYCRENDLYVTQGFTDPQRDHGRPGTDYELLRVVEEGPDGILVRGAKAVSTGAPYANEFLCLVVARPDVEPDQVAYFATPINTPGLTVVCRIPLARDDPDHRLSSAFDEMDSYVIFEDVFVPRERVFFLHRADLNARAFPLIFQWSNWHVLIRLAVKAEALAGIGVAMADYLGTTKALQVQTAIYELISYVETLRAFVRAAESEPVPSCSGLAAPNPHQVQFGLTYGIERHPHVIQVLREICGQGLLMAPGHADLSAQGLGTKVRRYLAGKDERALERFRMLKLAWELTGDGFGSRQLLFEMLNVGPLLTNKLALARDYDAAPFVRLAKELAGIGPDSSGDPPLPRKPNRL